MEDSGGPVGPLGERISTRRVEKRDAEFLFRVYSSTRMRELAFVDLDPATRESFLRQQFAAQASDYSAKDPQARHEIVLVGSSRAGRFWVARRAREIRVLDLALLPEFRRSGVEERLLDDLKRASETGGVPIRLCVLADRPDHERLYTEMGFRRVEDMGVRVLLEWNSTTADNHAAPVSPSSPDGPSSRSQ